jgi:hypothetical protein
MRDATDLKPAADLRRSQRSGRAMPGLAPLGALAGLLVWRRI